MPKEKPLQTLDMLQRIREAKYVVFIVGGVEVGYNGTCFENWTRWCLVIINDNWDPP